MKARPIDTSRILGRAGRASLAAIILGASSTAAFAQGGLPAWIEPPEGSVRFGSSVASGADVDGDGVNDIFVSDPGVVTELGRVGKWYVYSGATREILWSVVGQDVTVTGNKQQQYKFPAAFIDDFDGDDLPDLLVGRSYALNAKGVVEIYGGRTGTLLFRIVGEANFSTVGVDVARLGDLDGDDVNEFCYVRAGWVEICSGATGELIDSLEVENARRVRDAGDLQGDHVSDIVVGRYDGSRSNGLSLFSGRTRRLLWSMEQPSPDDSSFGYNLAAGHDLDGDDVPDVLVTGNTGKTAFPPLVYLVSGATGEARAVPIDSDSGASPFVAWVALGDLTGDGRVEPFLGYVIGPINSNKQLNAYNHRPGPEPLDQPVYTVDWQLAGGVVFGTELCVEDVTGDGCAEVLLGSIDNTGVHIIGGSPMLLGHDYQTYAAFGERDVRRGTLARFAAVGNAEGRPVRLAASRRGNGCTFIPQLGICLDLDRPFQQIGQAVTDPDGFARFSLTVPPDTSLGPAWLQCLDINFPRRGPTTSNVMKIQIVE